MPKTLFYLLITGVYLWTGESQVQNVITIRKLGSLATFFMFWVILYLFPEKS
jgi:hypothetical protein